ncbi:MAG: uracil-DNA glycosylase family protein [Candidatus Bathyarchaeota archaeon]|nr:uracil-DNA glycosylase family protein [Candidatus Bathyarchaeota archaeon]
MSEGDDSWDIWRRDVEEFRTTLPCGGRRYQWLIGYLGNPDSKIMFVCEIPSLSKRFTQQQPPDSTDENLQWNVHAGDWLFRNMLCEFGFKENSPKEAGGWKCWITDFIKCPIENLNALDETERHSIFKRSARILEREIESLDPVLIVTVGNNAYQYFNKYVKITVPRLKKMTHYSYIMLRPDRDGRRAGDRKRIEEYREEFGRIRQPYEEELRKRSLEDCQSVHFSKRKLEVNAKMTSYLE